MSETTVDYLLQVQVPDPTIGGFRLDVTALDSPVPLSGLPGEFRLDRSTLADGDDDGRLTPVTAPLVWIDLMPYATSIRATQGNRPEPGFPLEAGSMSVTLRDCPDLDTLNLWPGAPIRVIRRESNPLWGIQYATFVWFGWIEDTSETWAPRDDAKLTSLRALDAVARLGNVTRYGARSAGPETYSARMARILASAPADLAAVLTVDGYSVFTGVYIDGYPVLIDGGELEPTSMETSLMKYVTMTAHSVGLVPYLRVMTGTFVADSLPDIPDMQLFTEDLRVVVNEQWTGEPIRAITLTDDMDIPVWYETLLSYYSLDVGTPALVASAIEITNHRIDGSGDVLDETTTVVNPTAVARFGRRATAIDVTANPNEIQHIGSMLLQPFNDSEIRPRSVTFDGRALLRSPDVWGDPRPANRGLVRPEQVAIRRLGRQWAARVVGIEDVFSPDPDAPGGIRHRMTLQLGYYL